MDKIYVKKTKKIRVYEEKEDKANISTICTEYECLCGKGKIVTNRIPGFEFYIDLKCPVCEEKYYSSVDLSGDDWVVYPRKKNN